MCCSGKVVVWLAVCIVLVLTLNFEVGEMLTMRLQEKKWEETGNWAVSGKIESQKQALCYRKMVLFFVVWLFYKLQNWELKQEQCTQPPKQQLFPEQHSIEWTLHLYGNNIVVKFFFHRLEDALQWKIWLPASPVLLKFCFNSKPSFSFVRKGQVINYTVAM